MSMLGLWDSAKGGVHESRLQAQPERLRSRKPGSADMGQSQVCCLQCKYTLRVHGIGSGYALLIQVGSFTIL